MVCSKILGNMARTSGVIMYTNKLIDYQFERREWEADEGLFIRIDSLLVDLPDTG
jgi:hypothetical protein